MNACMDAAATTAFWNGVGNALFLLCGAAVVIVFIFRFFR